VWDCLLLEGRKVLHRLCLALLAKAAPLLMQLDNAGMCVRCVRVYDVYVCWGEGDLLGSWFCASCKCSFARLCVMKHAAVHGWRAIHALLLFERSVIARSFSHVNCLLCNANYTFG
jgi:hypothetical protein